MFMKKIGDVTAEQSSIESFDRSKAWSDEQSFPKEFESQVFIKHIRGPLFFGSTSYFLKLVKQIPDSTTTIIIRMSRMPYMDQSGLYAMEDAFVELRKQKKTILLVGLQKQPRYMLERINIIPHLVPKDQIFETFDETLVWIKKNVKCED